MPRATAIPSPRLRLGAAALLSGAAALSYELLWGRLLALAFGSAAVAAAAVLAAFMLGLAAGSALGGVVADRTRRPGRVLGLLELAMVVVGPALTGCLLRAPAIAAMLLPRAGDVAEPGFVASRLGLALAMLLAPTAVMGATFPLLVRAAATSLEEAHRAVGWLYGGNVLGGVLGVVACGFLALPRMGVPGAVAAAAAANLGAGLLVLGLRPHDAGAPDDDGVPCEPVVRPPGWALAAAALSGAAVLAAETLWYRALGVVLANSSSTLALLLALTLAGLGLGGELAPRLLRRGEPRRTWAALQAAIAALLVVQALGLPWIAHLVRWLRPDDGWARVLAPPLALGAILILPVAFLMGAAWPLLLAAATRRLAAAGRSVGTLGLVNSLGAAVGASACGLVLLPLLGFGRSALVLASVHLALVGLGIRSGSRRRIVTALALASAVAAFAVPSFGRVPLPSLLGDRERVVIATRTGPTGTAVVTEHRATGVRDLTLDNSAVMGTTYDALKVARMLGLAPALLHPRPETVLVIGFGVGVTTATVAGAPGVERLEVVEIAPEVAALAPHFAAVNHDVLADPRVTLAQNDGRNHLLLGGGPYDVITCDPVHPLLGSAPLYSRDFFELARRRLAPGGLMCQYLPLHRIPEDAFSTAIATFQSVFPETWVLFGLGHAMLVGGERPLALDWPAWQERLTGHRFQPDLAASALSTPAQLFALLQLDPVACRRLGAPPISTDLHPVLEFLEPEAYAPGLWEANARRLVEAYRSPVDRVRGLPPGLAPQLERLVAGKRLLLFSLLERAAGRSDGARRWLETALEVAGDDPEVQLYAAQARREGWLR